LFTAQELKQIPLFEPVPETTLQKLADKTADVRLCKDEWLIREGETPYFYVIFEGTVEAVKEINGREEVLKQFKAPDFFGEVPILLGAPSLASIQAKTPSRILRMSPLQLKFLVDKVPEASQLIMKTLSDRLNAIQEFARDVPGIRAMVVGSRYDVDCREIRAFLTSNRIPYAWIDRDREPERIPSCLKEKMTEGPAVVVDQDICLSESPTVREVAQALGYQTAPEREAYDVVIVGAGPAGLAAGVYGASEGLRSLVVERAAVGGQAGTSSRIENYLGFPNGISGDELSERALKQAARFGAEIVVTREVRNVHPLSEGGYCIEMDGGDRVTTRCVVLATGVDWRRLEAEGIDRLRGRGVLYGASRMEAGSVVGKDIFIVGGGNSAGQAAMFFSSYARSVTVLVRGAGLKLTMSSYLIQQIAHRANITVEPYTQVVSVGGENSLETICTVKRGEQPRDRAAHALFIMIGADANTDWLPETLQRDERGYVCTGRDLPAEACGGRQPFLLETNMPGFFCVGDVRHDSIKRVSSSVGEGSMAIAFVHQYLAMLERDRAAAASALAQQYAFK
jgi:thioredoxin reductase (NADPH)